MAQTRTNKVTGEVQEMQADGSWKTVVPPSRQPGGPIFSVPTKPANPVLPYLVPKAQADATKAGAEAQIATAQAPVARDIAYANRDTAVANARAAEATAAGKIRLTPEVRATWIQNYNAAKQLKDIASGLDSKFSAGPGATKGLHGLEDYLPYAANQQFDAYANQARGIVGTTLGFTGGQLNTPQEAAKAIGPYIPESADRDPLATSKIESLHKLADDGLAKATQVLGGVPDANGNIIPVGADQQPASNDFQMNGGDQTRAQIDPMLKATGLKVGAMIARGVPDQTIRKFLEQSGVDPANTSIDQALQFRKSDDYKKWQRANPGKAYPIGPDFYTNQVPVSAARRIFNKTAATDLGGDVMASAAASANGIMGDRLSSAVGAASGDPEMAKTGMELLRTNHPASSFLGDVAGQATVEGLAGLVPGARPLMASKWGRRGVDGGYGYYSGSGDNAEDAGAGGLEGALANTIFGMAGRGAQKAVGKTMAGVQDAGLRYLHGQGVQLTPGRIAQGVGDIGDSGSSNLADDIGTGIAGIENRLAGFPGLEAFINPARKRGDVSLNKAIFRQIAPDVSGIAEDGLASAKRAETAAYSKLDPARMTVDPTFTSAIHAANPSALPHHANDVAGVIGDIQDQIANGEMSGKGFQTALQAIRKTRATLNDDVGGKAAAALDNLEQHVLDLGSRQGGNVAQDLATANGIHARRQIVKRAFATGPSQGNGLIPSKGLNQASIANTTKYGGSDLALSPNRPFFDLTNSAMKVMPNITPDSGTGGRMALLGGLGTAAGGLGGGIGALTGDGGTERAKTGGEIGLGGTLALGALLSAPYSKVGQKAIQKALLSERPDGMIKIGKFLVHKSALAGLLSSGAGRDYFLQPELPQ